MEAHILLNGFLLGVWLVTYSCQGEGCDLTARLKTGEGLQINSPNISHLSSPLQCVYDVTTTSSPGNILYLTILNVTLTCHDPNTRLDIYDGSNHSSANLGRICAGRDRLFMSPGDKLRLKFTFLGTKTVPWGHVHPPSFTLRVKSVPEYKHCYGQQPKILSVLSQERTFVTPYFPVQVAPGCVCRWLLKAAEGHRVHLHVLTSDMVESDNCSAYGLSVFDGKTSYDDDRLAVLCSNANLSVSSTSNYMMVVFTSGKLVPDTGSGVKLGYFSTPFDAGGKSSNLLFILIGLLLGMAAFTIVMTVLRFAIFPACRKSLTANLKPRTRGSTSSTVALVTRPGLTSQSSRDEELDASRLGLDSQRSINRGSFCCCLDTRAHHHVHSQPSDPSDPASQSPPRHQSVPATSGYTHLSLAPPSPLTAGLNPPIPPPFNLNFSTSTGQANEYHELPDSRRDVNDHVISYRLTSSHNPRLDSGFQGDSCEADTSADVDHLPEAVHPSPDNLPDPQVGPTDVAGLPSVSSLVDGQHLVRSHLTDLNGYEVPVAPRLDHYDQVREETEEAIYHNIEGSMEAP